MEVKKAFNKKKIKINVCVFSVSSYLHTIRGREKGSGSVCQQCETHHGQVSVHFRRNVPERSGLERMMMHMIIIFCILYLCAFSRALQIPTVDYSFEDCQLSMVKGPLCLPSHTCMLEFSRLVCKLGWVLTYRDSITSSYSGYDVWPASTNNMVQSCLAHCNAYGSMVENMLVDQACDWVDRYR